MTSKNIVLQSPLISLFSQLRLFALSYKIAGENARIYFQSTKEAKNMADLHSSPL